jgi:hypothetical protein
VACGIADGEKDGTAQLARAGERLIAPWIPVDRVMGVLEEVRTGFSRQSIGGAGNVVWI